MGDRIKTELENYISELETLIERMKNSDFPFSDASLVYKDVCDHLKAIVDAK